MTDEGLDAGLEAGQQSSPHHDSLDLETLVEQGRQYKAARRAMWRRIVLTCGLLLILYFGLWVKFNPKQGDLLVLDGNTWVKMPFEYTPLEIMTMADGTLLVNTVVSGLYGYNDLEWQKISNEISHAFDDIDVLGEEVWAVYERSVFQFDGENWITYADVLPTDEDVRIVASDFGAIVVDARGNITRYSQGQWKTDTISEIFPHFQYDNSEQIPQLEYMPDGSILLYYFGLWQFDNGEWQSIDPYYDQKLRLLGVDETRIWYSDSDTVNWYDPSTSDYDAYSWQEIGLSQDDNLKSISVGDDGVVWLIASDRAFAYDSEVWKPVDVLGSPYVITASSIDSTGHLWVSTINETVLEWGRFIVSGRTLLDMICFPAMTIVGLMIWSRHYQNGAKRAFELRKELAEAVPEFQAETPVFREVKVKKTSPYTTGCSLVVLFGIVCGISMLPFSPLVVFGLMILAIVSIATFSFIRQVFDKSLSKEDRAKSAIYVFWMIPYSMVMMASMIINLVFLTFIFGDVFPFIIILIVGMGIGFYLANTVFALPIVFVYRGPLAQGDYETALGWLTKFRWFMWEMGFKMLKALLLYYKGELNESERLQFEWLSNTAQSVPKTQALSLASLSFALLAQKHYERALPIVEATAKIGPDYGSSYMGLVHYYVEQGIYPERALAISNLMLDFVPRQPLLDLTGANNVRAECFAIHAMALANVGRYDEANEYVEKSLVTVNRRFKPALAYTYLELGKVKQVIGEDDVARRYFQQAAEIDPQGWSGRQARELLEGV